MRMGALSTVAGGAREAVPCCYGGSGLSQAQRLRPIDRCCDIDTCSLGRLSLVPIVHLYPPSHICFSSLPINRRFPPCRDELFPPAVSFPQLYHLGFYKRICLDSSLKIFSILSLFYKNGWKTKMHVATSDKKLKYHKHSERENGWRWSGVPKRLFSPTQSHVQYA